jgi:hypothetical protein
LKDENKRWKQEMCIKVKIGVNRWKRTGGRRKKVINKSDKKAGIGQSGMIGLQSK